jgi:hypothetical protein
LGGKDDSREVSVSEVIERLVLDLDLLRQQRGDDLHVDVRFGVPHPLDRLHAMPGEVFGERRQEVGRDPDAQADWATGTTRITGLPGPGVALPELALLVARGRLVIGARVVWPVDTGALLARLEDLSFQWRGLVHRPYLPPLAFLAPPTVATTFVGFFDTDDGNLEAAPLAVL